ncbi:Crp/Fnr family transcriptional regulator [Achromobacter seleniivolatilans]|uniref:Crp/Fnr family transcriptional regulator n=1 Tax=Achromobacter seleniivolatilans TaxID=3047478 RepID=A0ABY9M5E8_9BURK|nr:Crp/Fnr family transcriptional regulator [Achromobacter sp. R39]WMD22238.1 Crp/Fnr family transcriptional regulator [Achromobacter sp. R39]
MLNSHPVLDGGTNRLLNAMPDHERPGLLARFEPVDLIFGQCLLQPGERMKNVYFPTQSYISLILPIKRGTSLEVGLIGNEGMWSVDVPLGTDTSPLRAVVQGTGAALRMTTALFRQEMLASMALRELINRYTVVILQQLAQSSVCMHSHLVEGRLARWLLMTQDRAHADTFHLTHEYLAHMLGVRRVGVTVAASALQQRKLIAYHRGNIEILDRRGLEVAACDCYEADRLSYSRMGAAAL